jgi:hypothetical protein
VRGLGGTRRITWGCVGSPPNQPQLYATWVALVARAKAAAGGSGPSVRALALALALLLALARSGALACSSAADARPGGVP